MSASFAWSVEDSIRRQWKRLFSSILRAFRHDWFGCTALRFHHVVLMIVLQVDATMTHDGNKNDRRGYR